MSTDVLPQPAAEPASPASPSLSHALSKVRRRSRRKSDIASLLPGDLSRASSRKPSFDNLAADRQNSIASLNESESSGLGRLLSKSRVSRRHRRRTKYDRDLDDDAPTTSSRSLTDPMADETTREAAGDGDTGSSMMTLESDDEVEPPERPPLSTHPSHTGYLTSSSPLVNAAIVDPEAAQSPSAAHRALTQSKSSSSLHGATRKRAASTTRAPARSRGNSLSLRLGALIGDRQPTSEAPGNILAPDVTVRPSTPERDPIAPAPLIVNTPPTPTEPLTPASLNRERGQSDPVSSIASNPNIIVSPSGNMISHRRVRSGSAATPSNLAHVTNAPLTPISGSPSGTSTPPNGFFSTVFSAAQNAASTITTITNSTLSQATSKKPVTIPEASSEVDDDVEVEGGTQNMSDDSGEQKELAVKTLGSGDLTLSQFGIMDTYSGPNSPVHASFQDQDGVDEPLKQVSSSSQPDDSADAVAEKMRVVTDISASGEKSPLSGSVFEGKTGTGLYRTGSVRSAMGARRKRGSSGVQSALGAAIVAANASLANPAAQTAPKLTGFAVASKKRNRDFHQLFRSVPEDDYLIDDYSCALQREILAHGRLYVSEGHLCFSSNIFGWVTTLVMSFDEIVSVEKRSTALVFKNGLVISTLHAKNIFASFTSRDSTYDLIVGIWKLSHPSLRSSLNGVMLGEPGGGDKTEKYEPPPSITDASSDESGSDEEEVYDEDEDEEDGVSIPGETPELDAGERSLGRVPSGPLTNGAVAEKESDGAAGGAQDFPGPATHAPTSCSDGDSHYERVIFDEVISAPLGKIYDLIFGPTSVTFMSKWLTNDQKCTELQMDDKKGLTADNKSRSFNYIKPLGGSIGPKQTKCICTETIDALDLEKAVSITVITQTPDVPSGNVFVVKTRYCLTWADNNTTRVLTNCTIEWSGKSWLKGPIEKGANDGQIQYAKELATAVRSAVASKPKAGPALKGKKKGAKRAAKADISEPTAPAAVKVAEKQDWGVLEPLHGLFGPVVDLIKPLLTGNILYGILVGLLVTSWFSFGGRAPLPAAHSSLSFSTPERLAAYEEIWRQQESELWAWLDERVHGHGAAGHPIAPRLHVAESHVIADRLRDSPMRDRELEEAILVTEEKLNVLKAAVAKKAASSAQAKVEL